MKSTRPKPPVHISIQHDTETRIDDSTKTSTFRDADRDSDVSLGYSGHTTEKELQSPITPVTPVGVAFLDLHADRQKEPFFDTDKKCLH